jgi:DNA-binding response OmpR family regulator
MTVALRIKGYVVEAAADGDQAIQWTERHNPSLIVLDMHMPALDGWGFAAELRKQGHDVPILVLTTGDSEAATAADDVGARGYLPKPFGLRDLLDAVSRLAPPLSREVVPPRNS